MCAAYSLLDLEALCGNHMWQGVLRAPGTVGFSRGCCLLSFFTCSLWTFLDPQDPPCHLLGTASCPRVQMSLWSQRGAQGSHRAASLCICSSGWCNRLGFGLGRILVQTSDALLTTWCWGSCIEGVKGSVEDSQQGWARMQFSSLPRGGGAVCLPLVWPCASQSERAGI